jgi:hypothetical protein
MKACVLLSGKIRNAKDCFDSIKTNLIDVYKADVFLSTWETDETDDVNIHELIQMYSPKSIEIEKYDNELIKPFNDKLTPFLNNTYGIETRPLFVFLMYYKMMKANRLKESYETLIKKKYDIVIRTRFDLKIDSKLEYIIPNQNEIYIPKGWDWRDGYNDLFAIGNSYTMGYYSNLYFSLINMLNSGHVLHPELLLKSYLDKGGFDIIRQKIDLSLRGIKVHEKKVVY